jgi:hypothetical protein
VYWAFIQPLHLFAFGRTWYFSKCFNILYYFSSHFKVIFCVLDTLANPSFDVIIAYTSFLFILAFNFFFLVLRLVRGLTMSFLLGSKFRNFASLILMTMRWKMLTKEDEEWASMHSCGWKLFLMNGECFVAMTRKNHRRFFWRQKFYQRFCWHVIHLLFCKLQRKMAAYILQPSTSFFSFNFFFLVFDSTKRFTC